MFENILNFFKNLTKKEKKENNVKSKDTAKDRLHLVLMQDRANVSADFLEMMKQEIIEVIKKYIEVEEQAIDVRLTNEVREDGTVGAPLLYANFPILNIKNDKKKEIDNNIKEESKEKNEEKNEENNEAENRAETVNEELKKQDENVKEEDANKDDDKKTEEIEENKDGE